MGAEIGVDGDMVDLDRAGDVADAPLAGNSEDLDPAGDLVGDSEDTLDLEDAPEGGDMEGDLDGDLHACRCVA